MGHQHGRRFMGLGHQYNIVDLSSGAEGSKLYLETGLHEVNRQPSNGLKFNRQLPTKFIFYRQPTKRFKVFQSSLYISADLH